MTDDSPLVSIIIPTYNNADVVCQAIDCSFQQSYERKEIIVIDDGSTDDTRRLLADPYGDSIRYLRQENRGAGCARNTGLRNASGSYLQFLDADDLLDPDKIRMQIAALGKLEQMALSYCDYVKCDLEDPSVHFDGSYVSPKLQEENPLEDLILRWETELSIPIHCFLFDARLFKENGISFDESLPANEDWDCWMDLFALRPGIVYIDRVLAYYRMRRESRCSDRLKMRRSHLVAINNQLKKNKNKREIVSKLNARISKIRFHYRDVGLLMRVMDKCPPVFKKLYCEIMPWRIQRIFD